MFLYGLSCPDPSMLALDFIHSDLLVFLRGSKRMGFFLLIFGLV